VNVYFEDKWICKYTKPETQNICQNKQNQTFITINKS